MKQRTIAAHPLLFAVHPILALYASNVSLIPLSELWLPCLIAGAGSLVLWVLSAFAFRSSVRGARVASGVAFAFFSFGTVSETLARTSLGWGTTMGIWIAVTVAIVVPATWKWKDEKRLNTLLNLAGSLMCISAIAVIVIAQLSIKSRLQDARSKVVTKTSVSNTTTPDIYYIILDGFGRDDILHTKYGVTGTSLADQLESRGFYIARDAKSNYVQTQLSLASSLNFQPIQSLLTPFGSASTERMALNALIDESHTASTLKSLGYRTFAITTGFPALTFPSADVRIEDDGGRSLFFDALLQKTPIRPSDGYVKSMFDDRRDLIRGGFEQLKNLAEESAAPKFVFVHILAPHPPFVFGSEGEAIRPKGPFSFVDGNHFHAGSGSPEEYRVHYRDQAVYIGKLLVEAVDELIVRHRNQPIIIVQGDHGPKAGLNQDVVQGTDVSQVFPILSSYYVPVETRKILYPGITPVNTFRAIFKTNFGMDLPLLEDKSYYSSWSEPLKFTVVTGQLAHRTDN